MHKETVIAILIGLTLGLLMTYGIYRFRQATSDEKVTNLEEIVEVDSTEENSGDLIQLDSPDDGLVTANATVSVSGSTLPNSHVVLFVGNAESLTDTDETGAFSFQADLEDGANVLTVTVIAKDGQTSSIERLVVVEKSNETSADTNESNEASTSADEKL